MPMDVGDMPQQAGPSHQLHMDMDNEQHDHRDEDKNNNITDLPHIPAVTATTSQTTCCLASTAELSISTAPSQVNHFLSFPVPDPQSLLTCICNRSTDIGNITDVWQIWQVCRC